MKKTIILFALLASLASLRLSAQEVQSVSVKDLAPAFGVNPLFLDDTAMAAQYLDSINTDYHTLTDTCVAINARVLAFQSVMMYDYPHRNDTVWVSDRIFLNDYNLYSGKLSDLSTFVLRRAHDYIEREHKQQDDLQQSTTLLVKDTIARQHRTIVNACEGFGVTDSDTTFLPYPPTRTTSRHSRVSRHSSSILSTTCLSPTMSATASRISTIP